MPNVVLVLCCWVTGNELRAGSDRLLHFLLLTEPSTTYAVLKWFLLFLFLSRFTSSCVSSLVQVVLNLLLGYSKVEYIDNGWNMFSVILFKHFYVPMNVILKDSHPIHICNCLNLVHSSYSCSETRELVYNSPSCFRLSTQPFVVLCSKHTWY